MDCSKRDLQSPEPKPCKIRSNHGLVAARPMASKIRSNHGLIAARPMSGQSNPNPSQGEQNKPCHEIPNPSHAKQTLTLAMYPSQPEQLQEGQEKSMEAGAGVGMWRELAFRSRRRRRERLGTRGRRRSVDLRSSARRSAARRWPSAGGDQTRWWGIGDWIRPGGWIEPGVWGFVRNVPPFREGGWAFRSLHAGAGGFGDWRGFSFFGVEAGEAGAGAGGGRFLGFWGLSFHVSGRDVLGFFG